MSRPPRGLATIPLSVVFHVALVVGGLALVHREAPRPELFIDLGEILAISGDGRGAGSPATGEPGSQDRAPRRAARSAGTRPAPAASSVSRSEAAPTQEVARPREPVPAPPPLPVTPPVAATSPPPVPPSASASSASTPPVPDDVATSSAGSTSAGGTARAGGAGMSAIGGASGDSGGTGDRGSGVAGRGGPMSAAITPGAGSGIGDGSGTEYADYLARVRQRIQDSLRYPPAARRRGVTGTVQLEIAIGVDGAIAAVSVDTSSSHELLDRAAVEAARSAPRVPFPANVRPTPLRVRLPVRFELQ